MHETASPQWGFFRRPALLGPAVGFFAFLCSEAIRFLSSETMRSTEPGILEGLIWLPFLLFVATVFGAIPYLIGAFLLLAAFRVLPNGLTRWVVCRLVLGGLVGALLAWPFSTVLNWIPSATAEPRFYFGSMLVACAIAGGFCAVFFSQADSSATSNTSLERTREE